MKATELMILDWVAYKHKYMSNPLLCEVISIDAPHGELVLRHLQSNDIDEFGNRDYKVIKTRYEDTFPIPLTPEILEKNEWEKLIGENPVEVWSIGKGTYLHKTDNGYKLREGAEFNVLNIQYVHTLQHAFRLCGLEEMADNFKI